MQRQRPGVRTQNVILMQSEEQNPYYPSVAPVAARAPHHQASLLRGFACAVPSAAAGFAVAFLMFATILLVRYLIAGETMPDPESELRRNLRGAILPSAGLAFVFGLAAILNYTPARRFGLVRSIMFVGLAALAGDMTSALAEFLFDIGPQTYTSDPWAWLRSLIVVSVPVAYTVIHTGVRFKDREGNLAEHN